MFPSSFPPTPSLRGGQRPTRQSIQHSWIASHSFAMTKKENRHCEVVYHRDNPKSKQSSLKNSHRSKSVSLLVKRSSTFYKIKHFPCSITKKQCYALKPRFLDARTCHAARGMTSYVIARSVSDVAIHYHLQKM